MGVTMLKTYTASIWDHEDQCWEPRYTGITKWGLRAVVRELYSQGWSQVSFLVEREMIED